MLFLVQYKPFENYNILAQLSFCSSINHRKKLLGSEGLNMKNQLIDNFGRKITYLRISVTDRCDFRCTYCMTENMEFLPKSDVLTIEEMYRVCHTFISMGVRKIRITGGEPLVRKNVMQLFQYLGDLKRQGHLDEICVTTNGSTLEKHAQALKDAGVERVNVSLDTQDEETFNALTRTNKFHIVMAGIQKAKEVGLKIKINTVALNKINDKQVRQLVAYCIKNDFDITFIEVMPMGDMGGEDRLNSFLPLEEVKKELAIDYVLTPISHTTGGPSKYHQVENTNTKVGFITPLSNTFCRDCNRVRVTCTGTLFSCLGQDNNVELLPIVRTNDGWEKPLSEAIVRAIYEKPKEHNFVISEDSQMSVNRHMSVTGG